MGEPIASNQVKEETKETKFIKTSLTKCFEDYMDSIRSEADHTTPHFFIIDDIFAFGYTNDMILNAIRNLRVLVEDLFSVFLCYDF